MKLSHQKWGTELIWRRAHLEALSSTKVLVHFLIKVYADRSLCFWVWNLFKGSTNFMLECLVSRVSACLLVKANAVIISSWSGVTEAYCAGGSGLWKNPYHCQVVGLPWMWWDLVRDSSQFCWPYSGPWQGKLAFGGGSGLMISLLLINSQV